MPQGMRVVAPTTDELQVELENAVERIAKLEEQLFETISPLNRLATQVERIDRKTDRAAASGAPCWSGNFR